MKGKFLHYGDLVKVSSQGTDLYRIVELDHYHKKVTVKHNGNEPITIPKSDCIRIYQITESQDKILNAVCKVYKLEYNQLLSKSRYAPIPDAKKIAWVLMNEQYTMCQIADVFNNDHSNISLGILKAKFWLENDRHYKAIFNEVVAELNK